MRAAVLFCLAALGAAAPVPVLPSSGPSANNGIMDTSTEREIPYCDGSLCDPSETRIPETHPRPEDMTPVRRPTVAKKCRYLYPGGPCIVVPYFPRPLNSTTTRPHTPTARPPHPTGVLDRPRIIPSNKVDT